MILLPNFIHNMEDNIMFRLQGLNFYFPEWIDSKLFYIKDTLSHKNGEIYCKAGDTVDFQTYFGLFPIAFWRDHCGISDLYLKISGKGSISVHISVMGELGDVLLTEIIDFDLENKESINLSLFLQPVYFCLSIKILAKNEVTIRYIDFLTNQHPVRNINIGLVITTFKRENIVYDSIERLLNFIEKNNVKMHLCVVDNGETIKIENNSEHITLLKNKNTGGAGGFARGLSFFDEQGDYSHVIFMDDDASTIEESLLRTIAFFSHCKNSHTAITAAMLCKEVTRKVHEQGAVFEWAPTHRIVSRKHGLDLSKRNDLLELIREQRIDYGGWWYFAFPLFQNIKYPYPMFVRGDDWLFSYLNTFEIVAVLGVASWQESFEGKLSPVEQYLAMKAFLVAEIMLRTPINPKATTKFFANWILRAITGYCYDRAELSYEAVKDVLRGPEFWATNVSLEKRIAELKKLVTQEKFLKITNREKEYEWYNHKVNNDENKFLKFFSIYGVLLPLFLCHKAPVKVKPRWAPLPNAAYRRELVEYTDDKITFRAYRDGKRAIILTAKSSWLLMLLMLNISSLQRRYIKSVDSICTKKWWDRSNT